MAKKSKGFKRIKKINAIIILMFLLVYLIGSIFFQDKINEIYSSMGIFDDAIYYNYNKDEYPEYSDKDYIILNNNEPEFTSEDKENTSSFESYSELDSLGRCGVAYANLSVDLMPTEARESIGMIKPSGWHLVKYDIVESKYLYNRCHLIGFQLSGENANAANLITCTRQLNAGIMLDYENMVAEYIKSTNNHVLYRVTPIFIDDNLVASSVKIEAYSVEDNGKGIKFNVLLYNIQDGIEIDYKTGDSALKK